MPTRFRKRVGRNTKANLTQNGWTSTTFTNNAGGGGVRMNYNTKRDISMSLPGTGLYWRNSGYNRSAQKTSEEGFIQWGFVWVGLLLMFLHPAIGLAFMSLAIVVPILSVILALSLYLLKWFFIGVGIIMMLGALVS